MQALVEVLQKENEAERVLLEGLLVKKKLIQIKRMLRLFFKTLGLI
jgi:hypothetical protein